MVCMYPEILFSSEEGTFTPKINLNQFSRALCKAKKSFKQVEFMTIFNFFIMIFLGKDQNKLQKQMVTNVCSIIKV